MRRSARFGLQILLLATAVPGGVLTLNTIAHTVGASGTLSNCMDFGKGDIDNITGFVLIADDSPALCILQSILETRSVSGE